MAFGCTPKTTNTYDKATLKESIAPEPESGVSPLKKHSAQHYMAVTANPLATQAATRILSTGGSAIDAAIAAQMVLGLTEPQSSGIGGGGFLLYWDNKQKKLYSYDGRETAPSLAGENLFLSSADKTMPFFEAVIGGRSVGVPGLVAMLEKAHKAHGQHAWLTLFDDAINLASNGFSVSPRLNQLIRKVPHLQEREPLASYLFNTDGAARAVGEQIINLEYADTLRHIAAIGSDYIYRGEFAKKVVAAVNNDKNVGSLSLQDMARYKSLERKPVCLPVYEQQVCGMGPPSSGGITTLQILAMLDANKAHKHEPHSAAFIHMFAEASRLAFADRNTYIADPDFAEIPARNLLDMDYLTARAALIHPDHALNKVIPGKPPNFNDDLYTMSVSPEYQSTTHISIVDRYGNIASMTSSIETAFGSRLMVDGVILNNQLTDFSFSPRHSNGALVANRADAGKRPRSSMSPTIVLDPSGSQAIMAIGSPGGARIIDYVAKTLAVTLSGQQLLVDAIRSPHIVHIGGSLELEASSQTSVKEISKLERKGHSVTSRAQTSGIHAISITGTKWARDEANGKWLGIADPRREGTADGR